ncbi:STAS domain-containing protein [Nonomuraea sp. NPDC050556]|uniref:STAS domain-containing protein n=1 Tax=Nonomuraea sp. NPDC050556 TaxID=3364369 RepID=UPI0037B74FE5
MAFRLASPTAIDDSPLLSGARAGRNLMTVLDTTTVHLSGAIDALTLREKLLGALRHSTSRLVLDLSEVTFCDASGLAVLVDIQRRARAQGVTLALWAPSACVSRLLRITGLDRGLPVLV